MKVIIAKNDGFCFGVRKAIEAVYQNLDKKPLYTWGPIIHNPQMVEALAEKGVCVIDDIADVSGGCVVIRSHGVPKATQESLYQSGAEVIDATCPFVKRIHETVQKHYANGEEIYIIGKHDHPEVIGINGWCENSAKVIYEPEDMDAIQPTARGCVVAQTTITPEKWDQMLSLLKPLVKELYIYNTICNTTSARQAEAVEVANNSDVVLVVGGKNSSNTQKLYEICKAVCARVYHIENPLDIPPNAIKLTDTVGIISGASTPDWVIKEVVDTMNNLEHEKKEPIIDEASTQETEEKTVIPEIKEETPKLEEEIPKLEIEEEPSASETEEEVLPLEMEQETSETEMSFEDSLDKTMVQLHKKQVLNGTVVYVTDTEVCVSVGYKSDGFISKDEFSSDSNVDLRSSVKPGDVLEVEVLEVNDGEGSIAFSRKRLKDNNIWEKFETEYHAGQKEFDVIGEKVIKGGLLADLNGIKVFIPTSQLSSRREDVAPESLIKKKFTAGILEIDPSRRRIVASRRKIEEEKNKKQEHELMQTLQKGNIIKGKVARLTDFGAFIDIGGKDGLLHITEMSWGRVKHPSQVLKIGQVIDVIIRSIDIEKGQISLGYRELNEDPWLSAAERYAVGSVLEVPVVRTTSFGAFVNLEPGVDGLIHISQLSHKRIARVEDAVHIGDVVLAKVIQVDGEKKRISLSVTEADEKDENVDSQESVEQTIEQVVDDSAVNQVNE